MGMMVGTETPLENNRVFNNPKQTTETSVEQHVYKEQWTSVIVKSLGLLCSKRVRLLNSNTNLDSALFLPK